MKIVITVLLLCVSVFAQLPNAPTPQQKDSWKEFSGKSATFLTYRGSNKYAPTAFWDRPTLRSNRQTFDKKFVILHGMAVAAMIVACKRKSSGEDFASEAPAVAGVTGLDYLMSRLFTEAMSVEAPPYMIQHYIRSAYK